MGYGKNGISFSIICSKFMLKIWNIHQFLCSFIRSSTPEPDRSGHQEGAADGSASSQALG